MSHDTASSHPLYHPCEALRPPDHIQASVGAAVELHDPAPETVAGTILDRPTLVIILSRGTAVLSWREGLNGQRRPIHQQSAWFIPAGVPHATRWLEPARVLRISFPALPAELADAPVPGEPLLVRLVDIERMCWNVAFLSRQLQAHQAVPAALSAQFVHEAIAFARLVLICLLGPAPLYRNRGLAIDRFESVADFIEDNIGLKFNRETLARTDGQSLSHFARVFKERIGLTPRQYIDRRRCIRARELIERGMKLSDVAAAVGFFDQPEMCKKFNLVFGRPPRTYSKSD